MKKFTSIAAALCLATAFCGLCTACSKHSMGGSKPEDPENPGTVTDPENPENPGSNDNNENNSNNNGVAGEKAVVLLLPGSNYKNGTKVLNKVAEGDGIVKLTADEAAIYYEDNAYICTLASGAKLPTPTSDRTDIKFVGWRYPVDGVMTTVTAMPADVTVDLYLTAEWETVKA